MNLATMIRVLISQDNFKYHAHVNSIRVTGTDVAPKNLAGCFLPSKVQLEIHAYDLNIQDTLSPTAAFGTSADAKAKIISIPHESLDKVWEKYAACLLTESALHC